MARQETVLKLNTEAKGKHSVRIFDRITVDDIVLHLMRRELYSVVTDTPVDSSVPQKYKDALIKARNPVT